MNIRAQIVTLASTPAGVSNREIAEAFGMSYSAAGSNLNRLTKQTRLYCGQRAGQPLRWFADKSHCDAWKLAAPNGQNAQTVMPQRLTAIGKPLKNRARQPSKAPPLLAGSDQRRAVPPPVTVDLAWRDPAGEVDYSRAVYTLDTTPKPTARWQMLPDEPPLGFAKLPLGASLMGVMA